MKQLRLSLILCASFYRIATAQITIPQSDLQALFNPGGFLQYYSDTSSTIVNVGRTGGPNVYDFTSLSFVRNADLHIFLVSQSPQLAARYPNNGFFWAESIQSINDVAVLLFSSNALSVAGDRITITPDSQRYRHNVPLELFNQYPLTYGSSWTTSFTKYDTTYINNIPVRIEVGSHATTVVVDGYGTLRIPGHELQCLRLRDFADLSTGNSKSFFYLTREGAFFSVDTRTSQADTGNVQAEGVVYFLGGSLVGVRENEASPPTFFLKQNYPNPFNPSTAIQFSLQRSEFVTLTIFNILGEEIAVLVEKSLSAGTHRVEWDAAGFPSAVYLYRLQAGSFIQTRKLLLLR